MIHKIYKVSALRKESIDILKSLSRKKILSVVQTEGFIGIARNYVNASRTSLLTNIVKKHSKTHQRRI